MAPGGERDLEDGVGADGLWEESNWSRTSIIGDREISFMASYIL